MTKINSTSIATIILVVFLTSCSSNSSTESSSNSSTESSSSGSSSSTSKTSETSSKVTEKDPYEIMHIAFEGYPEISEIKPMLEAVMDNYSFPKTDDNRLKVGNMLVALRKASEAGVTEMQILKHIYKYGSNKISLPEQAGLSATLLETNK